MNTRLGFGILVVQHVCLGRSVLENAWHHRGVVVGGETSRTSASSGRTGKTRAAEAGRSFIMHSLQRGGEQSSRGEGRCEGHRVGPRLAGRHHPGLRMSGPRPGCKTSYGPPRASTTPSANTIRAKTRLRRPIHEACTLSRLASGESGLSRHISVARGPT